MDEILEDLGLQSVISRFRDNQICPADVVSLTETEFMNLGVTRIGDRARLRARCRDVIAGESASSPVVRKLIELNTSRGGMRRGNINARRPGRKDNQETLRFYVGWQRFVRNKGYKVVTVSRGGGTHHVDFHKKATLSNMNSTIKDIFFPDGKNEVQDLCLDQVTCKLCNFSGEPLQQQFDACRSDGFTAGDYYAAVRTHPVRIYLLTAMKDKDTEQTDDQTMDHSEENTTQTDHQTMAPSPVLHDNTMDLEMSDEEDLPQFVDTGTPTITFRVPSNATSAVQDSATSRTAPQPSTSSSQDDLAEESVEAILNRLRHKLDIDGKKNIINVTRGDVMAGARRGFQRSSFNEERCLSVRFSGEDGIDDGGPSREFMRLVLIDIKDSKLFGGQDNAKSLQVDIAAEEKGEYYLAGKIISYCLVHGGPPPRFFSESAYSMLTGKPQVVPRDIDDSELRDNVQKIADATDEGAFQAAVSKVEDIVDYIGAVPLARFSRKNQLVHALTIHIVVKRKRDVLDQFKQGLSCLGVTKEIHRFPETMKELFVNRGSSLDAVQVDSLFTVQFSPAGSNRRRDELTTQTQWRDFLQDLEETGSLGQVLTFVTGLDDIPPLGFQPQPGIEFSHPGDTNDIQAGVPFANTCANSLRLPVLPDFEAFKTVMLLALEVGTLFTNA